MLALRKAAAETTVAVRLHGTASLSLPLPWAEPVLAIVVWLTDREFRIGAGRRGLAFDAWQRRSYQAPVYRTFVGGLRRCILFAAFSLVILCASLVVWRARLAFFVSRGDECGRLRLLFRQQRLARRVVQLRRGESLRRERGRRFGLAANARDFGLFVFVISVARRAARLFHVVTDHRDDYVVCHAPLTRAIVVQNVTKPRLALLHQNSRTGPQRNPRKEKKKVKVKLW
jgi:hypothetical protein